MGSASSNNSIKLRQGVIGFCLRSQKQQRLRRVFVPIRNESIEWTLTRFHREVIVLKKSHLFFATCPSMMVSCSGVIEKSLRHIR